MYDHDHHHHHCPFAAFLLGGLIGAAVGIFFAPGKGKDTRKKFKAWAEDAYHDGKEKVMHHAHELKEEFVEGAHEAKEKLAHKGHELAHRAGAIKERVISRAENLKHKAAEHFKEHEEEK